MQQGEVSSTEVHNWMTDSLFQLESKLKEFRSKADPNKRKKGSKTDNSRRSAEQIEDHKKMLLKLQKVIQKDSAYISDNVRYRDDYRTRI